MQVHQKYTEGIPGGTCEVHGCRLAPAPRRRPAARRPHACLHTPRRSFSGPKRKPLASRPARTSRSRRRTRPRVATEAASRTGDLQQRRPVQSLGRQPRLIVQREVRVFLLGGKHLDRTQPTEKVTHWAAGSRLASYRHAACTDAGRSEVLKPAIHTRVPGAACARHGAGTVTAGCWPGSSRILATEPAGGQAAARSSRPMWPESPARSGPARARCPARPEDRHASVSRLSIHPVLQLTHTSWNTIARVSAAPT